MWFFRIVVYGNCLGKVGVRIWFRFDCYFFIGGLLGNY